MRTARSVGTVKWFLISKGFGYIAESSGPDVFVHTSSINGQGFKSLAAGDRVEFNRVAGPKGPWAAHVDRRIENNA